MKDETKKTSWGIGAMVLLLSAVVCKVLGALFRFPLTNLLGFEGIGIFQMIMSLYSFSLVATCGGITTTLSKLISSARAKGGNAKIGAYFVRALLFGIVSGLLFGLIFFFCGKNIATFQAIQDGGSYMLFLALLPLGSVMASLRGYFQGYENMFPTAISQIVEQVVKFALGLAFAYLFGKNGVVNGVFGAFVGVLASEVLSLLVIVVWFCLRKERLTYTKNLVVRREFDKVYFMLLAIMVIIPFTNAIDGLVIVPRLMKSGIQAEEAVKLFGVQSGVVGTILNLPLIISISAATALLPSISFAISKGKNAKKLIEKSLKILLFLILPTTFGLVAISRQMLPLFYVGMDEQILQTACELMFYGGFSVIFTALMQFVTMILQAAGQFKFNLIIVSIGGALKIILTVILAGFAEINVFAIVFGNILLYACVCVAALVRLKQHVDFVLGFMDAFVLLFSTLCMYVAVVSFLQSDYFGSVANLIIGVLIGMAVYCVFTIPFSIKFFQKERKFV